MFGAEANVSAAANILSDTGQLGSEFKALTETDRALVAEVLSAVDEGQAAFALTLLRETLSERSVTVLANLREVMRCVPSIPFLTSNSIDALGALGYEATSRSLRRVYDDGGEVFGLEFLGQGKVVEAIVIHTRDGRHCLRACEDLIVDEGVAHVMVVDSGLSLGLLEALHTLGVCCEPKFWKSSVEYFDNHAANAAGRALGELF